MKKDKMMKAESLGGKGFNIWYSRVYDSKGSQNIDFHEIACEAGAEVLRKHGIKCHVSSRLD